MDDQILGAVRARTFMMKIRITFPERRMNWPLSSKGTLCGTKYVKILTKVTKISEQ